MKKNNSLLNDSAPFIIKVLKVFLIFVNFFFVIQIPNPNLKFIFLIITSLGWFLYYLGSGIKVKGSTKSLLSIIGISIIILSFVIAVPIYHLSSVPGIGK